MSAALARAEREARRALAEYRATCPNMFMAHEIESRGLAALHSARSEWHSVAAQGREELERVAAGRETNVERWPLMPGETEPAFRAASRRLAAALRAVLAAHAEAVSA